MNSYTDQFDRDGYVVIRGVFSPQEVGDMRARIQRQLETDESQGNVLTEATLEVKVGKPDLLTNVHLRDVLLDQRVIDIARMLLRCDSVVYFADSAYHVGSGPRGFHRDNIDRDYEAGGPDWESNYPLIRMGI